MKNPQEIAILRNNETEYAIAYKDESFGVYGTKDAILADLSKNMETMKVEDEDM